MLSLHSFLCFTCFCVTLQKKNNTMILKKKTTQINDQTQTTCHVTCHYLLWNHLDTVSGQICGSDGCQSVQHLVNTRKTQRQCLSLWEERHLTVCMLQPSQKWNLPCMQTHSRPCSLPNTSWPAWPCTAKHIRFVYEPFGRLQSQQLEYKKKSDFLELTSADWKIRNVLVRERRPVSHQVGQTAKTRPANDGHLRPLFSVGKEPVGCLFVLLILVSGRDKIAAMRFKECALWKKKTKTQR